MFFAGIYNSQTDILNPDGFRQNVLALLLATLSINILSLALPVMTLQVYDRVLPNPGTGTLSVLVIGVCVAIILEAALRLARSYVIGRTGSAYEHRMACIAMGRILNADLSRIGSYGIGEHLHRMASVSKLKDFYNGYALTVISELLFVFLFLGLIIYIGQELAFVPALILSGFIFISLWRGHCLRRALRAREDVDDKRFNFLIETLEGVHTLKAFALEKFFERRYEALEENSSFENYKVTQETAGTFNTGAIFSHLMVISVISVGAWFVLEGMLTTGGLIATLLLAGRMMQPVQKALTLWARYQDYVLARERMEDLFATPQREVQPRASQNLILPNGVAEISHLSFKHHGQENFLLRDINLKINRGDVLLVSGSHGAGKTSLLNLLAGIYPPTEGQITIDGENINSYSSEDLVNHVGYIRSLPLIFRGTIRDNVTCFGNVAEDSAKDIVSLLGVYDDVAKLPGGFDTFLNGNSTDNIPLGLKQRIAMARVLALKPRLILFDNADRSLDKDGYAAIYSLLAKVKGRASMVLVSDDRNLCALANRHYVLKDGRLLEDEVKGQTSNVSLYKELW